MTAVAARADLMAALARWRVAKDEATRHAVNAAWMTFIRTIDKGKFVRRPT